MRLYTIGLSAAAAAAAADNYWRSYRFHVMPVIDTIHGFEILSHDSDIHISRNLTSTAEWKEDSC
jgi:hypothetical protein